MSGDGAERYPTKCEINESGDPDAPAESHQGEELAEHDGIHESAYMSSVSLEGENEE